MIETRYPVRTEVEVAWGEMDALGHLNNSYYFRYMENARLLYLKEIGWPYEQSVLASAQCSFRFPVRYPDRVRVEVGCGRVSPRAITLEYRLFSSGQGRYVASGETMVSCYDYAAGESLPISAEVDAAIRALEKLEEGSQ